MSRRDIEAAIFIAVCLLLLGGTLAAAWLTDQPGVIEEADLR